MILLRHLPIKDLTGNYKSSGEWGSYLAPSWKQELLGYFDENKFLFTEFSVSWNLTFPNPCPWLVFENNLTLPGPPWTLPNHMVITWFFFFEIFFSVFTYCPHCPSSVKLLGLLLFKRGPRNGFTAALFNLSYEAVSGQLLAAPNLKKKSSLLQVWLKLW